MAHLKIAIICRFVIAETIVQSVGSVRYVVGVSALGQVWFGGFLSIPASACFTIRTRIT